ncbi:MAG: flavin reductase family protein [Actinobacteria bacterium]|nr:flavin reductase family protein [Cyanobacteriota bacterium]MCL6086941.1 flavin reductase family protein [Actinomycetota bacterium]
MKLLQKVQNLVLPLPVTLATCRANKNDLSTDNIIPLSWVGIVDYKPNMLYVSIGKGKYSAKIIKQNKEFGLCIASVDIMEQIDKCGYSHGDKVDKFKMTGFIKFPAEKINVSLIKECPICLECKVTETMELNTHEIFIAEVLSTHVDEKFLGDDEEPLISKMNILCYVNDQYWTMGKKLKDLYYSK